MKHQYRKKPAVPVVIEAFQMTHKRCYERKDWPVWLGKAAEKESTEKGSLSFTYQTSDETKLRIHTLKRMMLVEWGDYIIQGVQSELYSCKKDIFEATYDTVDEEQSNENTAESS